MTTMKDYFEPNLHSAKVVESAPENVRGEPITMIPEGDFTS